MDPRRPAAITETAVGRQFSASRLDRRMDTSDHRPLYQIARPKNSETLAAVALDEAHAPDKVLAHGDLLRKFIAGEEFPPVHMRLGIMGACNMRCNFCNFHSPNEENFYDLFSYK